MAERDEHYNRDIAEAERIVQSMRRGSRLGRVLWLLGEGIASGLEIEAEILAELRGTRDALSEILRILNGETAPGASAGIISINGNPSTATGDNTMADSIRDDAAPASLSVEWDDSKGAIVTNVQDAWSGDNDAVGLVGPHPTDPAAATFTPVAPGTVNVKVIGTNEDGTTVELTDSITVTPGDAVSGTIKLTPGV